MQKSTNMTSFILMMEVACFDTKWRAPYGFLQRQLSFSPSGVCMKLSPLGNRNMLAKARQGQPEAQQQQHRNNNISPWVKPWLYCWNVKEIIAKRQRVLNGTTVIHQDTHTTYSMLSFNRMCVCNPGKFFIRHLKNSTQTLSTELCCWF